ncbi:MAG TPA: M20 family metallopeptidase [Terriglobales bacterium]|nr:M20 family metallopeptidase [Terriglobales bacterium]
MPKLKQSSLTSANANSATELLRFAESRFDQIIDDIRQLVELESPSNNKQAVDRCGEFIKQRFAELGGKIKVHRQKAFGDQLQIDFAADRRAGSNKAAPILLLGHYDTVWDVGTLETMPFRNEKGRLWGPGVFDMKAGIAFALHAITALREVAGGLPRPVTVLLNPDEEVGSEVSRKVTEQLASKSAAVLVLEPAQGLDGKVKTARKGVGDFSVKVNGVAAHSGLDFENGQNAVVELAKQIEFISNFTDLSRGLTVSVNIVRGGTKTNVVPAEASADVDVRIGKLKDGAVIEKKFRSLKPFNRKCKLEVTGGINRPPLERTKGVAALYDLARGIYGEFGANLGEAAVGGGSDGNFTGALGIPTLDGLGPVGEGAHAKNESIVVAELPKRVALIAGLMARL